MPICYVLVGLPGTGKSTLVAEKLNAFDAPSFTYSTDNVIERIAQTRNKTYNEVFMEAVDEATAEMDRFLEIAISENLDVIWDQTNLGAKKRKKIINRMKQNGYAVECFCILPPNGSFERGRWKERLNSRPGKTIPENILIKMEESYVMPTVDEGFDEVRTFNMFGGEISY